MQSFSSSIDKQWLDDTYTTSVTFGSNKDQASLLLNLNSDLTYITTTECNDSPQYYRKYNPQASVTSQNAKLRTIINNDKDEHIVGHLFEDTVCI